MRRWASTVVLCGAVSLLSLVQVGAAAAASPSIDSQWVTDITSSDATLHAEIDPNGEEVAYELQIDTSGKFKFWTSALCPLILVPNGPCAPAMHLADPLLPGLVRPVQFRLLAGSESEHVSVSMGSIGVTLQPDTTYYFRATAVNDSGSAQGQAQAFTTDSPAKAILDGGPGFMEVPGGGQNTGAGEPPPAPELATVPASAKGANRCRRKAVQRSHRKTKAVAVGHRRSVPRRCPR